MQKLNGRLHKVVDGIGWGLFLILIGILFLAQNQGWLKSDGWPYFAIGLGGIMTMAGLTLLLTRQSDHWNAAGRVVCGLALLYIGMAFLNGFGDWWALALIPIGISCMVKAIWGQNSLEIA